MPVFGGDTPVGAGMLWYTNTAPANWLICDGAAVSRTQYGALFAILGTTYGAGNGSTTFNLPDLRQRFPIGKAASGTANTIASIGGNIDHTHTVPAHHHGMGTGADLNITSSGSGTTGNQSADHTHSGTTGTVSANHTHTIPFAISDIVYAWSVSGGGTAAFVVAGTTTTSTISANHTHSLTTGGVSSNHTHTTPNHTHGSANIAGRIGLVTGGVDGNAAMTSGNNNPPYLVVNYIIKAA